MAKALGVTPEEEHKTGLHTLSKVRLDKKFHCMMLNP